MRLFLFWIREFRRLRFCRHNACMDMEWWEGYRRNRYGYPVWLAEDKPGFDNGDN